MRSSGIDGLPAAGRAPTIKPGSPVAWTRLAFLRGTVVPKCSSIYYALPPGTRWPSVLALVYGIQPSIGMLRRAGDRECLGSPFVSIAGGHDAGSRVLRRPGRAGEEEGGEGERGLEGNEAPACYTGLWTRGSNAELSSYQKGWNAEHSLYVNGDDKLEGGISKFLETEGAYGAYREH